MAKQVKPKRIPKIWKYAHPISASTLLIYDLARWLAVNVGKQNHEWCIRYVPSTGQHVVYTDRADTLIQFAFQYTQS